MVIRRKSSPDHPVVQDRVTDIAPRVATTITVTVMIGFALVAVTYVQAAHPPLWATATALVLIGVLFFLQFTHSFPGRVPRLAGRRKQTLLLQAILTFGPFFIFGQAWLGMPGFLGASCLLILPPALGWSCVVGVLAATEVEYFVSARSVGEAAYLAVATALTTLTVYGMSQLAEIVREVHTSRSELARMAVVQERLRFARDLHDLLGYSLSTVILKCELAHRLSGRQPERTQGELADILQITRQALSDVRVVAGGYRELSLGAELASVESILATIDIDAQISVEHGELPVAAETVLATVLREAVSNMLRHSKAQQCLISVTEEAGSVRLRISNDGVDEQHAPSRTLLADTGPAGSGLGNLSYRVGSVGGELSTERRADGWFEITATIPLARGPSRAAEHSFEAIA
jgi:two-component system, NarL family, sensor histidine kinase DesK